jgi:hypothetical protein
VGVVDYRHRAVLLRNPANLSKVRDIAVHAENTFRYHYLSPRNVHELVQMLSVIVFEYLHMRATEPASVNDACVVQLVAKYRRLVIGKSSHRAEVCHVSGGIYKRRVFPAMPGKNFLKLFNGRVVSCYQA